MENKESLKATAVIRKTPDLIKDDVDLLLADSVMTPSIYRSVQTLAVIPTVCKLLTVARSVLFPSDHRLWVEEFAVLARSDFVYDIGFQINIKRTRNVFPRRRFRKKGAKAIGAVPSHVFTALKTTIWLRTTKGMLRRVRK